MERVKVFVDSSVLIAAVLSSRGGSFYILQHFEDECEFQINEYVLEETLGVLTKKFPAREDLRRKMFLLLGSVPVRILPNPPKEELAALKRFINKKDAPILASALKHSSYFLTLDSDFLINPVVVYSEKRGLNISNPKAFIDKFRRNSQF